MSTLSSRLLGTLNNKELYAPKSLTIQPDSPKEAIERITRHMKDMPPTSGLEPVPIDALDRLRNVLFGFTEDDWCELARQLQPSRVPPVRLINRSAIIAWLKTWMHR
jgi:hypothetical protein